MKGRAQGYPSSQVSLFIPLFIKIGLMFSDWPFSYD